MKLAACIIVYNDWRLIKACIRQIPMEVSKVLVLISKSPWNGNRSEDAWRVEKEVSAADREGVEIVSFDWKLESEQRNWGLGRLYDFDWVFTLDADEFFTPEDWKKMLEFVPTLHLGTPNLVPSGVMTYWKTWDYAWNTDDNHRPPIAINPKQEVFFDKRGTVSDMRRESGATLHHLSWVRTDKDAWQKIENYMHAKDFDRDAWFQNVWLRWEPGDTELELRPYGVEKETRARRCLLPDSIKAYFDIDPLEMK